MGVKFSSTTRVSIAGIARFTVLETFKRYNENQGSLINLQGLCCLHMIFACRAKPFVIFIQKLRLIKLFKTVGKGNRTALL